MVKPKDFSAFLLSAFTVLLRFFLEFQFMLITTVVESSLVVMLGGVKVRFST